MSARGGSSQRMLIQQAETKGHFYLSNSAITGHDTLIRWWSEILLAAYSRGQRTFRDCVAGDAAIAIVVFYGVGCEKLPRSVESNEVRVCPILATQHSYQVCVWIEVSRNKRSRA